MKYYAFHLDAYADVVSYVICERLPKTQYKTFENLHRQKEKIDYTFDYLKLYDNFSATPDTSEGNLSDVYFNFLDMQCLGRYPLLISTKVKELLESVKLPKQDCFYAAKLLFQGNKLDYYVYMPYDTCFNSLMLWDLSEFSTREGVDINDYTGPKLNLENFMSIENDYYINKGITINHKKIVLKEDYDFFFASTFNTGSFVVSARLKEKMEQHHIFGVTFDEVPFEFEAV